MERVASVPLTRRCGEGKFENSQAPTEGFYRVGARSGPRWMRAKEDNDVNWNENRRDVMNIIANVVIASSHQCVFGNTGGKVGIFQHDCKCSVLKGFHLDKAYTS